MDGFKEFLAQMKAFFDSGLGNILQFILVGIIGLIIVKIVLTVIRKALNKSKMDKTLKSILIGVIKFALLMIYAITLLSIIGIPLTSLLTILTGLTLAISLAIQSSLSNFANGMVIIANKPYLLDDYVEINGIGGTVIAIKMMHTKLRTPTNEIITIPHNQTINANIKNFSTEEFRRVDLTVSVSYASDVEQVKQVVMDMITSHDKVLKDKANLVRLKTCNSSSLDFIARAWVKNEDYWEVYYDLTECILKALQDNNIEVPFPQLDVNFKDTNKLPENTQKE